MSRCRNFFATIVRAVAPGAVNTEFAVEHGLTVTPHQGFVIRRSAAALLYLGPTTWDDTNAYVKSDTAYAQFYVLFFV